MTTRKSGGEVTNECRMKHVKGGMGRCVEALLLCFIFVSASATRIGAQSLSGDLRNTTIDIAKGTSGDVGLHVQTKEGKQVAKAGITVNEGDKVQFDSIGWLTTMTAGFWTGVDGETYIVDCCNKDRTEFSKLKLKGEVRWNTDRNVIKGSENFLQVKTRAAPKDWITIAKTDLVDGRLCIITEQGDSYIVDMLSSDYMARLVRYGPASAHGISPMFTIGLFVALPLLVLGGIVLVVRRSRRQ